MKKENIYKFLYAIAILLIIGFAIRLGVDYYKYNSYNSAPFYLSIIIRSIEFIIPSIIIFIIGKVMKNKYLK